MFEIIRRVEKNGVGYTVVLDRSLWNVAVPEGRAPLPGQRYEVLPYENARVQTATRPEIVRGVLLTDYRIHRDDDPNWRAWVTLAGDPPMGNEHDVTPSRVYVANVQIQSGRRGLTTTALPLADLLNACVRCGEVALRRNDRGTYDFIPDEEGLPMPAAQLADLTGYRRRRTENTPERYAEVLRLCEEHNTARAAWKADPSLLKPPVQATYVAERLGVAQHTARELIKDARKRAGLTQKNRPSKGDSK